MEKTTEPKRLKLKEIEDLLSTKQVLVDPEDDRNPVAIAAFLGLIDLIEVDRVQTGYFDGVDQSRMITQGQIIRPIAYGQQVLQAVERQPAMQISGMASQL